MVCQSVPPVKQGTQRDSLSFFKTQPVQSSGTAGKATAFLNVLLHLWSGQVFCSVHSSWKVICEHDCWIPWFPDCIYEQFAPSFWSTKQDKLYPNKTSCIGSLSPDEFAVTFPALQFQPSTLLSLMDGEHCAPDNVYTATLKQPNYWFLWMHLAGSSNLVLILNTLFSLLH